jgi:hypothetical protein
MNIHPSISIKSKNPFSMKGTLLDFKKVYPGIQNLDEIHTQRVILQKAPTKKSCESVVKISPKL